MKQAIIGNELYVYLNEPQVIDLSGVDMGEIDKVYVQEELYDLFLEQNPELEGKLAKKNYLIHTVQEPVWYETMVQPEPVKVEIVVDDSQVEGIYPYDEGGYVVVPKSFSTSPEGYEQYVTVDVDGNVGYEGIHWVTGSYPVNYTLEDGDGYIGDKKSYTILITQEPRPDVIPDGWTNHQIFSAEDTVTGNSLTFTTLPYSIQDGTGRETLQIFCDIESKQGPALPWNKTQIQDGENTIELPSEMTSGAYAMTVRYELWSNKTGDLLHAIWYYYNFNYAQAAPEPVQVTIEVDTNEVAASYPYDGEGYSFTPKEFTTNPTGYEDHVVIDVDGNSQIEGMILTEGNHTVNYTLADGDGYVGDAKSYTIVVTKEAAPEELDIIPDGWSNGDEVSAENTVTGNSLTFTTLPYSVQGGDGMEYVQIFYTIKEATEGTEIVSETPTQAEGENTIELPSTITSGAYTMTVEYQLHDGDGALVTSIQYTYKFNYEPYILTYDYSYISGNYIATCTGFEGNDPVDLVIPSTVVNNKKTYHVREITNDAFMNCGLTTIDIGLEVTDVGERVFANNSSGSPVNVWMRASTPPTKGADVFAGTTLGTLHVQQGALSTYQSSDWGNLSWQSIVDDIQVLDFEYNEETNTATITGTSYSTLTGINIPKTVTKDNVTYTVTAIAKLAFSDKKNITSVNFPEYEEGDVDINVGQAAFIGTAVTSVHIPKNVTSGSRIFNTCNSLEDITIEDGSYGFKTSDFGVLNNSSSKDKLTRVELKHVTPPLVSKSVFNNRDLSTCTLVVPKGTLDAYNQSDWASLGFLAIVEKESGDEEQEPIQVTIEVDTNEVTASYAYDAEGYAFTPKSFTTNPTGYEDNVSISVGSQAYNEGMTLSEGTYTVNYVLNSTDEYTGDSKAYTIIVTKEATPEPSYTLQYTYDKSSPTANCDGFVGDDPVNLVIPSTVDYNGNTYRVRMITKNAFSALSSQESLKSVTLPDRLTIIGKNSFTNNHALSTITIPDSVNQIADYAFSYCGLTTIVIGTGVTNVENGAFAANSGSSPVNVWMKRLTPPPTKGVDVFKGTTLGTLHVPQGKLADYQASKWYTEETWQSIVDDIVE